MKTIRCLSLLLALALLVLPTACAESYAPIEPDAEQRHAVNLFLSNFTEIGLNTYAEHGIWSLGTDADEQTLVDFAHDHLWFNDYDSYEYGEWGENNCRISDERIQSVIDDYIYDAPTVDLTQTRFDYEDGYYYHCETGGWTNCGFASVTSICPLGEDKYYVSFMVFGGGSDWENDVMNLTIEEAWEQYGHPNGYGHALVHSTDLADRSTYKLIALS